MPRLVADTNIYVSALVFGGVAEEVLLLARQHLVELFISAPILDETDGVLRRKFAWTPSRARDAMADIRGYATAVYPKEKIAAVVVDEPDNRILECAVEAKAHFVVSGDSHLRTLRQFRDILILSPRAFLDSFASLIREPLPEPPAMQPSHAPSGWGARDGQPGHKRAAWPKNDLVLLTPSGLAGMAFDMIEPVVVAAYVEKLMKDRARE